MFLKIVCRFSKNVVSTFFSCVIFQENFPIFFYKNSILIRSRQICTYDKKPFQFLFLIRKYLLLGKENELKLKNKYKKKKEKKKNVDFPQIFTSTFLIDFYRVPTIFTKLLQYIFFLNLVDYSEFHKYFAIFLHNFCFFLFAKKSISLRD